MKQFVLGSALLLGLSAGAQKVEDIEKAIYYERYITAKEKAHTTLQQEPNDAKAWYWLSQAYTQKKDIQTGLDSLSKAPSDVKDDALYKVAMGDLLLRQGKKAEAQKLFDEAKEATKEKNVDVLSGIAKAHIEAKEGDAQYALQILEKAIKRDKRSEQLYTLVGDAWRKLDNGTEAFKAYREALDKNNGYAAAHHKMGEIFLTQKNSELYLEHFNEALKQDSMYAPALYQLYAHYFVREPQKAMGFFKRYQAKSDATEENLYAYTDLLYLNKQYDAAISNANKIMKEKGADVAPRIYKLLAYSYQGLKDTATAYNHMLTYFAKEADSNEVVKDYEAMGVIYASMDGKSDSAAWYYEKAAGLQKDSAALFAYYKKISDLYKEADNYSDQAKWLGKYYTNNSKANNIDLFNWGIAHYRAKEYDLADSVFGNYTTQYPDQGFGYYWRARANTQRDSAMEKGLAVPHYQQMIAIAEKDTANETNKKWLIEAYGYIAAYKTNVEKDYASAIDYFKKLLVLNPEQEDAKKYIAILEKNLANEGENREDRAEAKTDKASVSTKEGR